MSDRPPAETGEHFDTLAVHAGWSSDPATGACAVPIYQTAAYLFGDAERAERLFDMQEPGNIYSRIMNPTVDALERRIAALEGGKAALAVGSGLAAETLALFTLAQCGDEVVSTTSLFGTTYILFRYILARMGIKVRFVDTADFDGLEKAITPRTKALYAETVGNPKMDVVDIERLADIAHAARLPLIIDNTTTSPALCQPLQWGADVVIHSLTKFIGGHGTSIGGIIVDGGKFDWRGSGRFAEFTDPDPSHHGRSYTEQFEELAFIGKARSQGMRTMGPCLSPFNAFLFIQGTETLALRMQRHSQNALAVANYLEKHPRVGFVSYPGLEMNPYHGLCKKYLPNGAGAVLTFGVKGGAAAAMRFINRLKLFKLLVNVGDTRSLVVHPATTTHQQMTEQEQREAGVMPESVRLSVGIEDIRDILADLTQALEKAGSEVTQDSGTRS